MDMDARKKNEPAEKKVYVEPKLEKKEKLQDVTQGALPVVTPVD